MLNRSFKRLSPIFTFFLLFVVIDAGASVFTPKYFQSGMEFQIYGEYFSTESNFVAGYFESLPEKSFFKNYQTLFGVRNMLSETWGFSIEGDIRGSESYNGIYSRTHSGLVGLNVSTDFLIIHEKNIDVFPEFFFKYPLLRNELNSDTVSLSEGAIEIGGKVNSQFHWSLLRPTFFLGGVYRDGGRSVLGLYGLRSDIRLFKNWSFIFEVSGYKSITKDSDSDTPYARSAYRKKVNAESDVFYSVNPDLVELRAWLHGNITKKWRSLFGGGGGLNGSQSAKGYSVFLGMSYLWDYNEEEKKSEFLENKFQEDTSLEMDKNIFQSN